MGIIAKLFRRVKLDLHFYKEAAAFAGFQCKYNASAATSRDMAKLQYAILRINHTLETGLSLPSPRKGFGHDKAIAILSQLESYLNKYGKVDADFVLYPLGTVAGYLEHCKKTKVSYPDVAALFEGVLSEYSEISGRKPELLPVGVETIDADELKKKAAGSFEELLSSRHSVRSFASGEIPEDVLKKALEMARLTPSACNRQSWKTHIFKGESIKKLLVWQDGCHGFEDQPACAILVCADARAFLSFEMHQAYVDGGLYAMNLINALHSLGLGTIPVSCGFDNSKIAVLHKEFGIPANEIPIVIVCAGLLPKEVKFATSRRKSIDSTNTVHE